MWLSHPAVRLLSPASFIPLKFLCMSVDTNENKTRSWLLLRRSLRMFSLVFAGEAIFTLPFHISRYFRPTFVDVFDVTQTELGVLGSIYGVVAMISYLFGGMLADRFQARKLLAFALLATGLSGFYLSSIPSYAEMKWLYAFWGASTILPFWAALIRATREWGGDEKQGEAFGVLDGGRGLLAAVLATFAVFVFSRMLPVVDVQATLAQRTTALTSVILLYTMACLASSICVWFLIPEEKAASKAAASERKHSHLIQVLRMPVVWLQAIVIIAAYCVFKGFDYYSQYAKDVWGWSEVDAARLSAYGSWMRPVAAITAGLIADRLTTSMAIIGSFVLTAATYISFLLAIPGDAAVWLLWVNVFASCFGIFALRGIYFALLEESRIPSEMTGTAVGVISLVGFTPEIFFPLLGGWLIDHWSGGETGYQVLFGFLCFSSIAGGLAAYVLHRIR